MTRWCFRFAILLFALVASIAGAAQPSVDVAEPATLYILNREIVTMRGTVAGMKPATRVERARARLREVPQAAIDLPISVVPLAIGEAHGVQFFLGDWLLFAVLHDDVDVEAKQTFDALVKQTEQRLQDIRVVWHQTRDRPLLLQGLLRSAVATLAVGLLVWGIYRFGAVVVRWLERRRDVIAARHAHVDWREFLARVTVGCMQIAQWFLIAVLVYVWLRLVLGGFAATAPVADELGSWLWSKLVWLAEGFADSIPGLVTIAIVLAITRAIADAFGYFFDAIHQGRLRLPMVHPETTTATRRIVSVLVWGLGIAIAYPYLPGSSSESFKGLSVLLGLMVTLGSTGLVTQAMSGLVLIYARALRKGDFVALNDVEGVVTEVAALATKIVNVRNEEITIPNSVLISSPIRNYSKLAGTQGTLLSTKVTIGYDAPWRQVHALLVQAAQKTPGVRSTPAPYVYQRALSDFYVEYELFASVDQPLQRVPILSAMHASIQDQFNEHGVQIMSPHFLSQPPNAVVVPKEQWYAPPTKPPS